MSDSDEIEKAPEDERIKNLAEQVRGRENEETSEEEDLLRPFDAQERGGLADQVFAALDAKAPEQADVIPIAQGKKTKPRGSSRAPAIAIVVFAAAMAAAAAFVLMSKPAPAPMAAYTLSIEGGNRATRGEPNTPETVIHLDPASRLVLELRPAAPNAGALAVRGFVVADGKALAWDAPFVVGKGGVVRVEGSAGALFEGVAEGTFELVIVIGRPETVSDEEALASVARGVLQMPALSVSRLRVSFSRPRGEGPGGGARDTNEKIVFAGCGAIREAMGCEIDPDAKLTFFVPHVAPSAVVIRVDNKVVEPDESTSLFAGARLAVKVPLGARSFVVTAANHDDFRLLLIPKEPLPEGLIAAEAARRKGALDEAQSLLVPLLADKSKPDVQRSALRQKARVVMAMGQNKEAAALLREAIVADKAVGHISDEIDDTFALSYGLLFHADKPEQSFGEVRALLANLHENLEACPEARPKASYYEGLLSLELGDFRATLLAFARASEGAERLGLDSYWGAVLEQEAEVLAVLGRHEEARARIGKARALATESGDVCRQAELLSNDGWIALRSGQKLDDARNVLLSALKIAREGCASGLGLVLMNLALLEIETSHPKEARQYLEEARKVGGLAKLNGWQRLASARLFLIEKKYEEALAASEMLRQEGEQTLSAELVFEGTLGKAEALAGLGRNREARSAYAETQTALASWGERVPLGEGRSTFLAARARGARRAITFLVDQFEKNKDEGYGREALSLARTSLSGVVQSAFPWMRKTPAKSANEGQSAAAQRRRDNAVSNYRRERAALEERVAAQRVGSADRVLDTQRIALRAALDTALAEFSLGGDNDQAKVKTAKSFSKGEALFVVHAAAEGYVGFLLSNGGLTLKTRWLKGKATSEWLEPFRAELQSVHRLHLVLPGELASLDWHVFSFEGAPLFERMEVVYSLDLAKAPRLHAPAPHGEVALLITDPTEDLPGARGSVDAVAKALVGRGMHVVRLDGAAATHEAVRNALEQEAVKLVHYAGHATFEGPDGLEASLRLAHGERFSVADVMALSSVPEIVVLVGCDTARAGVERASASGLGLGQAFLLKGASVSIAAPRPMGDGLAEQMSRLLYAELIEKDPSAAYRSTMAALRLVRPSEDWAVLRMLGG